MCCVSAELEDLILAFRSILKVCCWHTSKREISLKCVFFNQALAEVDCCHWMQLQQVCYDVLHQSPRGALLGLVAPGGEHRDLSLSSVGAASSCLQRLELAEDVRTANCHNKIKQKHYGHYQKELYSVKEKKNKKTMINIIHVKDKSEVHCLNNYLGKKVKFSWL